MTSAVFYSHLPKRRQTSTKPLLATPSQSRKHPATQYGRTRKNHTIHRNKTCNAQEDAYKTQSSTFTISYKPSLGGGNGAKRSANVTSHLYRYWAISLQPQPWPRPPKIPPPPPPQYSSYPGTTTAAWRTGAALENLPSAGEGRGRRPACGTRGPTPPGIFALSGSASGASLRLQTAPIRRSWGCPSWKRRKGARLLPIALSLQYADTRAAARQHPRAAAATDEHSSPRHGLPTPFENSREDISLGQRCSGRGNPQGGPQKAHQEGDTRGPDVHLSTVVLLGVPDLWRHVPVDKHAVIQDLLALSDERHRSLSLSRSLSLPLSDWVCFRDCVAVFPVGSWRFFVLRKKPSTIPPTGICRTVPHPAVRRHPLRGSSAFAAPCRSPSPPPHPHRWK